MTTAKYLKKLVPNFKADNNLIKISTKKTLLGRPLSSAMKNTYLQFLLTSLSSDFQSS